MAKATKAAGTTFTEEELSDPSPPVTVTRAVLGGELLSVGTDSFQSSGSETQSSDSVTHNLQEPARTTDSPSSTPTEAAEDVAPTTDGDGLTTGQESTEDDDDEEDETPTPKRARSTSRKARVRSTDDFGEFA